MSSERLRALHDAGQAIWLDFIDRTILQSGELARRIGNDHLTGMTSNPTIFEKALAEGTAYDVQISTILDLEPPALFEVIETDDVRAACDIFGALYRDSDGRDGYVSIEVSPSVAHDPAATVEEALRLWKTVARPNVMVKVPGTESGAMALEELIAAGVNVNVTLLFSVAAHQRVMDAYMRGLEKRLASGEPLSAVASVASFFVSRVDSEIDKRLAAMATEGRISEHERSALSGRAAIANARNAYRNFRTMFSGPRWEALAAGGARVQRPLWASTSTKNPSYRDVLYVEQLIGADTVNTMPPATIAAFSDHGEVANTVSSNTEEDARVLAALAQLGVDMDQVTEQLLEEGIASFQKSFDTLIAGLEQKAALLHGLLTSH